MAAYQKIIVGGVLVIVGFLSGWLFLPRRIAVYQPLPTFVANDVRDMADVVIFSYDRPMQLYAYLESIQKYVTGLRDTLVIYRTSDNDFERGYQVVQQAFPQVKFYQQTTVESFKPLLKYVTFGASTCQHILFGVDDIVMTDYVDVRDCVRAMDKLGAYGFYLRLGKNITCNYTNRKDIEYPLPPLKEVLPGIFAWQFQQGTTRDWSFSNSLDMSIVRKESFLECFCNDSYTTPNSLEGCLGKKLMKRRDQKKTGLCYAHSKMVNVPLNIVQEKHTERNMHFLSSKQLLEMFNRGIRIDIRPFFHIQNKAPHMEVVPTFVALEKVNN